MEERLAHVTFALRPKTECVNVVHWPVCLLQNYLPVGKRAIRFMQAGGFPELEGLSFDCFLVYIHAEARCLRNRVNRILYLRVVSEVLVLTR